MPGANRCEPYLHDVVAVRDGAVLRARGKEALYIVVNAPNERIRFRYLHMQPQAFDAEGLVSGRLVREGEVIGKVGNYFKGERATTYHLHFDIQVPTEHGWVFVSPYMTLVAAYERLIRGRGQEIRDHDVAPEAQAEVPTAALPARRPETAPPGDAASAIAAAAGTASAEPAAAAAKPTETTVKSALESSERTETGDRRDAAATDELPSVTASMPDAHGGGGPVGGSRHDGAGAGEQVRAVGGRFSRSGPRARYLRRHLHAGDGGAETRHSGL
jgi:hypothetical protein